MPASAPRSKPGPSTCARWRKRRSLAPASRRASPRSPPTTSSTARRVTTPRTTSPTREVYARTKRAGEEAALLLAPGAALCRVAVIFSGREGVKKTFAVGVVESLRAGRPVKAFVDQVVTPTLADNAAEMVLGVHRSDAGGVFHCSGATAVTRVEFCQALASKLGADASLIVPVRLAELKLPAPRPLRAGLRVDKVRRLLGSSAPLPLDAALDRFLDELRR